MDDFVFERAYYEDIGDVIALYHACALYSDLQSAAMWDEANPTFEMAEYDLDHNGLYVMRDEGRVIAAVSILPGNASFGGADDRTEHTDSSVLARLCVQPERQRRGLGTRVMNLAMERAGQLGSRSICLMCPADHVAMRRICRRSGFISAGIRRLYRHAFLMMERMITQINPPV